MGWFKRRPDEGPMTPEAVALRQGIAARGRPDLDGAQRYVDNYADQVIRASGAQDSQDARAWISDRMRVHLTYTMGPYFEMLRRRAPLSAPGLEAEYARLVGDCISYPASHLIAWWWALQPDLLQRNLDEFFDYRRVGTIDSVAEITAAGGKFRDKMFDWGS